MLLLVLVRQKVATARDYAVLAGVRVDIGVEQRNLLVLGQTAHVVMRVLIVLEHLMVGSALRIHQVRRLLVSWGCIRSVGGLVVMVMVVVDDAALRRVEVVEHVLPSVSRSELVRCLLARSVRRPRGSTSTGVPYGSVALVGGVADLVRNHVPA